MIIITVYVSHTPFLKLVAPFSALTGPQYHTTKLDHSAPHLNMQYPIITSLALMAITPTYAQRSSITSTPSMMPMATPSRPAVTMEWITEPSAALSATNLSESRSTASDDVMTMSDGSVMTMPSAMAMSGMSGMAATGTAMAGMNLTGAANTLNARRGSWENGDKLMLCLGFGSVVLSFVI
jgi:hypothetical protein